MSVTVAPPSPRYLQLISEWPLRSIASDEELDAATERALQLHTRGDLGDDETAYLGVLLTLIEHYEQGHYPIADSSDVEVLKMLIDSNSLSQLEVAAKSGVAVSTVSAILAGKRRMTRKHIEAFADYFHVPPAVFLPNRK